MDSVLASLERLEGGAGWHAMVLFDDIAVPLNFATDRHGQIESLRAGPLDNEALLAGWVLGDLAPCDGEHRTGPARLGGYPCADDALWLDEFRYRLQRGLDDGVPASRLDAAAERVGRLSVTPRASGPAPRQPTYPRPPHVPKPAEPDRCAMPAGKDCVTLNDDLDKAYLSECAYRTGLCRSNWEAIPPASIGLQPIDFHDAGFDAELYRDPATGNYTLAFRGTDADGDDWKANRDQARGRRSRQYELAYRLSLKVQIALAGNTLSFTGHSLGGGLATFAAVRTSLEADVFNPAALHPATADREGLLQEYENAARNVAVTTTFGDPITSTNRHLQNMGSYEARIAPGTHTMLADPPDDWIDAWPNVPFAPDGMTRRHSMAAVIESIETLLEKHCGRRRS